MGSLHWGYLLDQVEHNSLGHHIDHGALDNVIVRGDKQLYFI